MTTTALKIPSPKDAEQAQAAVRALSGLLRRKSPRTIRVQPEGIFEATLPGEVLDYRLDVDGDTRDDPYRYPPTLG
jgi:hypothetical protein